MNVDDTVSNTEKEFCKLWDISWFAAKIFDSNKNIPIWTEIRSLETYIQPCNQCRK